MRRWCARPPRSLTPRRVENEAAATINAEVGGLEIGVEIGPEQINISAQPTPDDAPQQPRPADRPVIIPPPGGADRPRGTRGRTATIAARPIAHLEPPADRVVPQTPLHPDSVWRLSNRAVQKALEGKRVGLKTTGWALAMAGATLLAGCDQSPQQRENGFAPSAEVDPAAHFRTMPEKELLQLAFQTAFKDGATTLTLGDTRYAFKPEGISWVGGRAVLISGGQGEDCHGCAGTLAVHYLEPRGDTLQLVGAWPQTATGTSLGAAARMDAAYRSRLQPRARDAGRRHLPGLYVQRGRTRRAQARCARDRRRRGPARL